MKSRAMFIASAWILSVSGCEQSHRYSSLPEIVAGKYTVTPYLRAAAELQSMGRDQACRVLDEAARTGSCEEQTIILCRMLFTKREGSEFRRPALGGAVFLGGADYSEWPLEPIALVDDMPFLIVRGYVLAGKAEPAKSYLDYCMASCDWNTTRFSERTEKEIQEAMKALLASSKWRGPLKASDRDFLSVQAQ